MFFFARPRRGSADDQGPSTRDSPDDAGRGPTHRGPVTPNAINATRMY